MTDFAFDAETPPAPGPRRRRNANLGTADAEEIFASFDTRIIRRFSAFLRPHPWSVIGALGMAVVSSAVQVLIPLTIGQAVSVATSGRAVGHRLHA